MLDNVCLIFYNLFIYIYNYWLGVNRVGLFRKFFSKEKKKEALLLKKLKLNVLRFPNDMISRRTLGDLYLKINDKDEAIKQFIWIVEHYKKEEFYVKAIAMYERIVKIDPHNEQYRFDLADIYVKNKMKTEAAAIYREFINRAKHEKNSDKIIELLSKVIDFDKNNIILRIEKATELLKSGDSEQAVVEYLFIVKHLFATEKFEEIEKLLISTGIEDNRLHGKLLICYIEQDKLKKGLDLIKKQKLENADDIGIYSSIIDIYLKKMMIKQALKINRKVFKKDAGAIDVFLKIAVHYLMSDRFEEAYDFLLPFINENMSLTKYNNVIEMLNLFMNYTMDFIPVLKKVSSVYKKREDKGLLVKHYEKLIPIYKKHNLTNDLKKILSELIEISDTPFTYKHQLADILGDEQYTKDDEINEDEEFLAHNKRLLSESILERDYKNAIEINNKIISKFPDDIDAKIKSIELLEKSGDLKKALEVANETISLLILQRKKSSTEDLRNLEPELVNGINLEDTALDFAISDIDVEELIIDLSNEEEDKEEIWGNDMENLTVRDSFKKQKTFKKTTAKKSDMQEILVEVSNSLADVLADNNQVCRSVSLKLVNTEQKTISKTITKDKNIYKSEDILICSKDLLKNLKTDKNEFRSLSISVSKLEAKAG